MIKEYENKAGVVDPRTYEIVNASLSITLPVAVHGDASSKRSLLRKKIKHWCEESLGPGALMDGRDGFEWIQDDATTNTK